jgi:predicted transcriptional regulator
MSSSPEILPPKKPPRQARSGRTSPASHLEQVRRMAHLSVTELADLTGFDQAYVSRVELNQVVPSLRFREAACRVLAECLTRNINAICFP